MEKDIFEMIKTRRSIRKYKKEVPDETLIRSLYRGAFSKNLESAQWMLIPDLVLEERTRVVCNGLQSS